MTSSNTVVLFGKTLTQDEMCSYLYENKAEYLSAWENLGTWRAKYSPGAMFSVTGQGDTLKLAEKELKETMILRMKGIQNLLESMASYTMEDLKNLWILDPGPPDFIVDDEDDGDESGRFSIAPLLQNKALEDFTPEQITLLAKIAQSKYSPVQEKERLLALTYGLAFILATVMIEEQSSKAAGPTLDLARNVLEEWASESGVHVHVTHCCVHGCKYGNENCPVELEEVQSEFHDKEPCICDH